MLLMDQVRPARGFELVMTWFVTVKYIAAMNSLFYGRALGSSQIHVAIGLIVKSRL
jgi:hypothetical protein